MKKKNDILIVFGKKVKEKRQKLGYTQEEFSEKVDIGTEFMSRIERGIGVPSFETLVKLSKTLNISLDELISEKVDKNTKIKNKKENLNNQIQHLVSDLNDKQKERIINIIKEVKKFANTLYWFWR